MNEKPMTKDEYIKYLLDYLLLKQKNFLRELEQENKTDRIAYLRGGLADTVDLICYLVAEYKRVVVEEERKSEISERVKTYVNFFIAELEEPKESGITQDYIKYLVTKYTL